MRSKRYALALKLVKVRIALLHLAPFPSCHQDDVNSSLSAVLTPAVLKTTKTSTS
jgi:hypothetical protein